MGVGKHVKRIVLVGGVILTGCVNLSHFEYFGGGAQYFLPQLDGELDFDGGGISGTNISLDSVLDVDDDEETVVFTGGLQLPGVFIDAKYFDVGYDGFNTLSAAITFLGQTFSVGADVDSEIDLQFGNLQAKVGLLETPSADFIPSLAVGAIVGLNYIDLEATITSLNPVQIRASEDIEGVFPSLGGVVVLNLPFGEEFELFADAELSGLVGDYDELEGHFVDARGRLGMRILSHFTVGAGYQFFQVDVEDEDDFDADVTLEGLFIFGEIGF